MRREQASGFLAIAEFYRKRGQFTAAQKYYSETIKLTAEGEPLYTQANRAFQELFTPRLTAALAAYNSGRTAEAGYDYETALDLYRQAEVGLSLGFEDIRKYAATPEEAKAAHRINDRIREDIRRLEEALARSRAGGRNY